ncbi:MAG: putative lipopolysaccharide heptosyltransferase III [Nitrospirae bacterium]|nr:putative lipopolysaccharide heptosyltransferase III [Nitrospirota bacterium]
MIHEFSAVNKILVIKLRHIGDVLLTVPVFRALKETFPDAHITALVNSGTEGVLKGVSLIDEIISYDRKIKQLPLTKKYLREIKFLRHIRNKRFNMTIDLTGGDRAAIISLASGAKYRIGWRSKKGFIGKKYLYTHLARPDGRMHAVLQNLEVIRRYGITTENLSIDFHIPETDRHFIREILKESKVTETTPVIHVHPTSRWLFKCWKDEYMAEIITWLINEGYIVVVTSSPDRREIEKAKGILSLVKGGLKGVIDLCGKTTIKQVAAVSEVSRLFFGVDSAPMHIAAAVGTPVIALFGPSGAFSWGPWDNINSKLKIQNSKIKNPYIQKNGIQTSGMHTVIQREWECIPCGKDGCNGSKISKCLEDIKPAEVTNIIKLYKKKAYKC